MDVQIEVSSSHGMTDSSWKLVPIVVRGNVAGLRSLARHLLTLAQEDVPSGSHVHLDDIGGLEPGSIELVLERA